jgi:hypothetical protein
MFSIGDLQVWQEPQEIPNGRNAHPRRKILAGQLA